MTKTPAADLADPELIQEWPCIDCDSEDVARTDELAAELEKRNLGAALNGIAHDPKVDRLDQIKLRALKVAKGLS